jgi:hypothetical protein
MFSGSASVGNLSVQLVYFRGQNESGIPGWRMTQKACAVVKIDCRGGAGQVHQILLHAKRESKNNP